MRFAILISILGTIYSSFNYSCAFDTNFKPQSQIQSIYSYYPLKTGNLHQVFKFYPISRESQDFNENSTISQTFDEISEGGSMFQFEIFPESTEDDKILEEIDQEPDTDPDESTVESGLGSGLTEPFCLAKLKGLKKKKLKILKKIKKLKKILFILKFLPILFPLVAPILLLPLLLLILLLPIPVIEVGGRKSTNNLHNISHLLTKINHNQIIDKLDQSSRQFSAS